MTAFTPWASFAGGMLIGLAAVLLMAFHGRIAGMTGIVSGLLPPAAPDWPWRAAFLAGAVAAPALLLASGRAVAFASPVPLPWVVLGGLLTGIGVHVGSGCSSGHGVCGLARLSRRSAVATATFMATAFGTVFAIRHLSGGL